MLAMVLVAMAVMEAAAKARGQGDPLADTGRQVERPSACVGAAARWPWVALSGLGGGAGGGRATGRWRRWRRQGPQGGLAVNAAPLHCSIVTRLRKFGKNVLFFDVVTVMHAGRSSQQWSWQRLSSSAGMEVAPSGGQECLERTAQAE